MEGLHPPLPDDVRDSKSIFATYMKEAMAMAFTYDPDERPSADKVAEKLKEGLEEMKNSKGD